MVFLVCWATCGFYMLSILFTLVPQNVIKRSKIILVCDGLDTVSTVIINGKVVGHSDNMFLRYIFDVKKVIKAGKNTIQVNFTSAIQYAKRKSQEYGYDVPPDCSVPVQRGECHRNFIRKEQSSFSWVRFKNQTVIDIVD